MLIQAQRMTSVVLNHTKDDRSLHQGNVPEMKFFMQYNFCSYFPFDFSLLGVLQ